MINRVTIMEVSKKHENVSKSRKCNSNFSCFFFFVVAFFHHFQYLFSHIVTLRG